MTDVGEKAGYVTPCEDPDAPKSLSPHSPVHGVGHMDLPCSSLAPSEGALLVWELAWRHGKGHSSGSRDLGRSDCHLTPLALLRNEAEPTDLWGLVTEGEGSLLSGPGKE